MFCFCDSGAVLSAWTDCLFSLSMLSARGNPHHLRHKKIFTTRALWQSKGSLLIKDTLNSHQCFLWVWVFTLVLFSTAIKKFYLLWFKQSQHFALHLREVHPGEDFFSFYSWKWPHAQSADLAGSLVKRRVSPASMFVWLRAI